MSMWSRITNVFRGDRLNREIDEELQAHVAEAVASGREPAEARRALGPALQQREASRDVRFVPWLDSLRADVVYGWRQILKRKVTSAAAILSLALGIGACTGAFRLIDAVLLRPLPVAHAERLYGAFLEGDDHGTIRRINEWAYPCFTRMRGAVKDRAELVAVSYAARTDLTYRTKSETERAYVQYVSGWMFGAFGLRPAVGRPLTADDDRKPRAHPVAVLSYDYWTRRFARDPDAVGRTFTLAGDLYQIVGVIDPPFTGTEPGTVTDIFVPTMMHPGVEHGDWTWMRTLAIVKPGVRIAPLNSILAATWHAFEEERLKGMSKQEVEQILNLKVVLQPAAAGDSNLQEDYRTALLTLAVLVALVLLIACGNVANLLTAQAAARAREMALRVSIGAGRARLLQLVLLESAIIAFLAAALGALFAWWAAPFVVARINPPDHPARLLLPADWRVMGFGLALTLAVTLFFGLAPALRASSVNPANALKGGADPHSRRRSMHAMIALQTAFCFVVLFLAGLFVTTFNRLSNRPTGFSAARLLNVETVADRDEPPVLWIQVADRLRTVPGVESVALAGWPLLAGGAWNGFVSVEGAPPGGELAYFMSVSPGWIDTVKIPWVEGRDLRATDATPGAVVNEAFVKMFLPVEPPLGTWFAKGDTRYTIVGVVRDAPYREMRESSVPVAYVPFGETAYGTFVVRTAAANPLAIASILRHEVPRARPEFRVSNIRTQQEIDDAHTIRERLLAMLALFFAAVALLLAGIGLYGVLDYSVVERHREIGIRIAIGAPTGNIARLVTAQIFLMVFAGAAAGLVLGMQSARYTAALLYHVHTSDPRMLALPALTILTAALVAALPAVIHAVRIDPAAMLRAD